MLKNDRMNIATAPTVCHVGTTRRDLLRLGAASLATYLATSIAPIAASVSTVASAVGTGAPTGRRGARFLVDCHVHVGGSPSLSQYIDQVHSPKDWLALRSQYPEEFANFASQPQVDNSDDLIAKMDQHGVSHAIVQAVPGRYASNQRVAEVAKRHKGRLFGIYRPESGMGDLGSGTLMQSPDQDKLRQNARQIAVEIEDIIPKLGMIGVGELPVGGLISSSTDPVEIARDMAPVMEALRPQKLPIQIPTGTSGWKGGLHYLYEPLWVDELAGNFPDVPIILTKMGRGIRTSFDACTVVAMRNANVYFDLTDSTGEHLREAVDRIGAHRILFGTDLHGISLNYAYDVGFHIVQGAQLSDEEWEWVAWRTADTVYQLGLAS